eukprot:COSAG01_NODE_3045_length_6671_cov_14.931396_5_plen_68_part_00
MVGAPRVDLDSVNCNIIEAPWLVNGGHGASLRLRISGPLRSRKTHTHNANNKAHLSHQRGDGVLRAC